MPLKKNQPNDRSHEKRSVLKVYAKGNLKSVIVKKDNLEGRLNLKKDKLHFFHIQQKLHTQYSLTKLNNVSQILKQCNFEASIFICFLSTIDY